MLRAIERGYVQQEIQNAAYEYQRSVDTGEAVVVGSTGTRVEDNSRFRHSMSMRLWNANRWSGFALCARGGTTKSGSAL